MENISEILSVPHELQVHIKSYLSDEEIKNYNLTCYLMSNYNLSISDMGKRCKLTNLSKEEIMKRERELYCGHLSCIMYRVNHKGYTLQDFRKDHMVLKLACDRGHLNIVKYLFEVVGMTVEDLRKDDNFVFNYTCKVSKLEIIKYFIDEVGYSIEDIRNDRFFILLGCSCFPNGYEVLKYLVERLNIPVEDLITNTEYDMNVLHLATASGKLDIMKYILNMCSKRVVRSIPRQFVRSLLLTSVSIAEKYNRSYISFSEAIVGRSSIIDVVKYLDSIFDFKLKDVYDDTICHGSIEYLEQPLKYALEYNLDVVDYFVRKGIIGINEVTNSYYPLMKKEFHLHGRMCALDRYVTRLTTTRHSRVTRTSSKSKSCIYDKNNSLTCKQCPSGTSKDSVYCEYHNKHLKIAYF